MLKKVGVGQKSRAADLMRSACTPPPLHLLPSMENHALQGGTGPGFFVEYDGEWDRGYRHGHGTRYYLNGEVYVGGWELNKRSGKGRYEYANGDVFDGEWVDDRRTGAASMSLSVHTRLFEQVQPPRMFRA